MPSLANAQDIENRYGLRYGSKSLPGRSLVVVPIMSQVLQPILHVVRPSKLTLASIPPLLEMPGQPTSQSTVQPVLPIWFKICELNDYYIKHAMSLGFTLIGVASLVGGYAYFSSRVDVEDVSDITQHTQVLNALQPLLLPKVIRREASGCPL